MAAEISWVVLYAFNFVLPDTLSDVTSSIDCFFNHDNLVLPAFRTKLFETTKLLQLACNINLTKFSNLIGL